MQESHFVLQNAGTPDFISYTKPFGFLISSKMITPKPCFEPKS